MAIVLDQLTRRYDGRAVVSNLSLDVSDGSLCVLLGPSGSGKSTVLRLIAGLATPDSGRVLLDGEDLDGVPPQKRDCGFVFQSYALFRRMTVADNVEFGLAVRGVPRAERRRRREELLELVGLAGLGGRLPSQLSGGQQQRVALARALAHRPRVLLLDEPFGALDARIRLELRRSLARIQRELAVTTLFVTHDQDEAFELADRVAVLAQGRLVEAGPPRELYLRPQTEFTAVFLGAANLWVGEATAGGVRLGPVEMQLAPPVRGDDVRRRLQVLVRPEDVALRRRSEELGHPALGEGVVTETSFSGAVERLRIRLPALPGVRVIQPPAPFGDEHVAVDASRAQHVARKEPLAPGDRVWVGVRRLHALLHPGLSLVAVDGGATAEAAREVARLAQARLEHTEGVTALADGTLAGPVDLVFARMPALHAVDEAERILAATGDAHLLLVREAVPMPPRRFLVAVAVGEPGKEDVAFVGRLARHLGSTATVLSVIEPDADELAARAAERFVAACARTLARWGVPAEPEAVRGDLASVIGRRMRDGHDVLVLGAPLPDGHGRRRWGREVRGILAAREQYPILVVRPGGAGARP
jgi:sulfate transport system ATP-binding protein